VSEWRPGFPGRFFAISASAHFDQPEMARHWEEVAVVVKERNTIPDAPSSNDKVDGLADGAAEPA
jgi:hypothetical protein